MRLLNLFKIANWPIKSISCLLLWMGLSTIFAFAQTNRFEINDYIIKENLIKNSKIAIIACDSNDNPIDYVNGTFLFTINGFKQSMQFRDGVAITAQEIEKSSFIFLKHQNEKGSHTKLYYLYKNDDGLKPFRISWIALIIIPLVLVLIASIFKRLIIFIVIAFLAFTYFNYNSGLSMDGLLETIFAGLKKLI